MVNTNMVHDGQACDYVMTHLNQKGSLVRMKFPGMCVSVTGVVAELCGNEEQTESLFYDFTCTNLNASSVV